MELQQGGSSYKDFLLTLEDGGWIGFYTYTLFYKDDLGREQRLAAAIDNGKINFKIMNGKSSQLFSLNELTDGHLNDRHLSEIYRNDNPKRRGVILNYLLYHPNISNNMHFMLEAKSFLSWLVKELMLRNRPNYSILEA